MSATKTSVAPNTDDDFSHVREISETGGLPTVDEWHETVMVLMGVRGLMIDRLAMRVGRRMHERGEPTGYEPVGVLSTHVAELRGLLAEMDATLAGLESWEDLRSIADDGRVHDAPYLNEYGKVDERNAELLEAV